MLVLLANPSTGSPPGPQGQVGFEVSIPPFKSMQRAEVHALGADTAETCFKHLTLRKGRGMLRNLLTPNLHSDLPSTCE